MSQKNHNRREFLQIGASGLAAIRLINRKTNAETIKSSDKNVELEEITVSELQSKMSSGEFSAKKLAEKYIERIKEIDQKINSVIEINPDALKSAYAFEQMTNARKPPKFLPTFV